MTRYDFHDAQDFLQEVPASELYDDILVAMVSLDSITGRRNHAITDRVFGVLAQCAGLLYALTPKSDMS